MSPDNTPKITTLPTPCGYKADVNVIDFENLNVRKPHIIADLPAGGRRVMQEAEGYLHTIVSGVEVYVDGKATGELPGRLIRGGQSAPQV